jgi:cysteine-rich repeat protein
VRDATRLLPALLLTLTGCSLVVDGALRDSTPMSGPCEGLDDGTPCVRQGIDALLVCQGGVCANSRCGDGLRDPRAEACDDGNAIEADGCENDCTETVRCASQFDCPSPGIECLEATCTDGECGIGLTADGTTCNTDVGAGTCAAGTCVSASCGDGVLDSGEGCDEGSDFSTGCAPGCQPSCTTNDECSQDPCFGLQECQTSAASNGGLLGVCVTITAPIDCGDPLCAFCDSVTAACLPSPSADVDGDLFASSACGGDDCDDGNPEINPGRIEECDADMLDVNCNPDDEPASSAYYADCDGDGFAAAGAEAVTSCEAPPVSGTCTSWTSRAPTSASTTDCHDGNATVRPNQTGFFGTGYTTPSGTTSFDYNCNGTNNPEFADAADPATVSCGGGITGCDTRPPSPLFPQRVACGASATLYGCEDVRIACRRTASTTPVVKRCR